MLFRCELEYGEVLMTRGFDTEDHRSISGGELSSYQVVGFISRKKRLDGLLLTFTNRPRTSNWIVCLQAVPIERCEAGAL